MTQYKSLHELAEQPDDPSPIKAAAWNSTPLVIFLQRSGRILAYGYFTVFVMTIPLGRISAHFDDPNGFIGWYWTITLIPLTVLLILWLIMWPIAWTMARRNYAVKGKANLGNLADVKYRKILAERASEYRGDIRRARWGTSALAYKLRGSIGFYSIYITAWIFSFYFAFNYLEYLQTGEPVRYRGTGGSHVVFDPNVEGWSLFYPFVILTTIAIIYVLLFEIAYFQSRGTFKKEMDWLLSLTFPVKGWIRAMGSFNRSYAVKVYYGKNPMPPITDLTNMARHLPWKTEYKRDKYDGETWDEFYMMLPDDSLGRKRPYRFHILFHTIIEALQRDYKITRVIIEQNISSSSEYEDHIGYDNSDLKEEPRG